MAGPDDEKYSAKEAQKRFEAALRGGLKTPPKPRQSVALKRTKAQRKKKPGK
jgi:hypothetical protein